jgi:GTP-binding protein
MEAYGAGLADKPEVLALSKVDAMDADDLTEKARALEDVAGLKPLFVSAVTGKGVPEVLAALAREVEAMRAGECRASVPQADERWRP